MSKEIREGTHVLVVWEDRRVWGVVVRTPAGPGDLWQIESDDGEVFALNPYARYFIKMEAV